MKPELHGAGLSRPGWGAVAPCHHPICWLPVPALLVFGFSAVRVQLSVCPCCQLDERPVAESGAFQRSPGAAQELVQQSKGGYSKS